MGNVKKSVTERTCHQIQYDRRVNKRLMQMQESKINTGKAIDDDLVVTKSSGTESEVQDDNSRSGNDTYADDADIKPIYDEEPMTEVQLTAECNIFAIGQQHTKQPKIVNEGRVDQYPKKRQVKSPMLDSSPDNQTAEYLKKSLESENILLKKTVAAQFQKDFSSGFPTGKLFGHLHYKVKVNPYMVQCRFPIIFHIAKQTRGLKVKVTSINVPEERNKVLILSASTLCNITRKSQSMVAENKRISQKHIVKVVSTNR
ncbi:hypothetical protein Tco_0152914 [Tanacetum coccineum]